MFLKKKIPSKVIERDKRCHLKTMIYTCIELLKKKYIMTAFSKESSFATATVAKFFNTIGACFRFLIDLNVQTNDIEEFYNSCKAAFSDERSQYLIEFVHYQNE